MKCPKCSSERINKNGHHHSKQNFGGIPVVVNLSNLMSQKATRMISSLLCLKMYLNGMGFRGIERVTGINHNTIINWVRIAALALPELPEGDEIPEITELDELQTFVGSKKTSFGSGLRSITGTQEL
jgi:transposase-like protein